MISNRPHFNQHTAHTRIGLFLILSLFIVFMSACSTLPPRQAHPIQLHTDVSVSETTLAGIIEPLSKKNEGLTGYHLLDEPLEALAARLQLIEKAEKTLDLQYYIWDNDKIGSLALHELLEAADRGVKVRLLIDDNNAKKMEASYLAFSQHPNIEVRLYNPHRFRHLRAMDFILDLRRMNRRMHNKSFIADNQIALIGGRNMSDQYFHSSDQYQFSDVDVLLVGFAAKQISESFDDYWNDEYSYPIEELIKPKKDPFDLDDLQKKLDEHFHKVSTQNYLDLAHYSQDFDHWLHYDIHFDWVKAIVFKDSPNKTRNAAAEDTYLTFQLMQHLNQPQSSLDIVSAYFVPESSGAERLAEIAQSGVKVRVLTNSFTANDVPLVHAFYSKYRKNLLENQVELYEFLATPESAYLNRNTEDLSKKAKISMKGLSRSSLHTKLMAIDDEQVFIGSFNFDPRSAYLNTEIGVLLESPKLAMAIHQTMDNDLRKYAYELMLNSQQKIQWKFQRHNGETEVYTEEPDLKWWKKLGLTIIGLLPIEGFI